MTEPMEHEELSELVAAYALDAVDPDEARLVEEHLAVCPRCRAELAEHREVTALLSHTGAPAPEGVWDRIASSLDEAPLEPSVADVLPFARPRPSVAPAPVPAIARVGRLPWFLGAAAAVVIALLGVQVARQDQQVDDLRDQVASSRGVDFDLERTLDDPDAEFVDLASPSGELRVRAVIDDDGRGFLLANNLPELAGGKTYQLWGAGTTDQPISLGVLGNDPRVVPFTVTDGVNALAITAEDAPGVVVSAADPVVAGELT